MRHREDREASTITSWLLGGVSELDGDPPHPRADLAIALAGPAASLASAGVLLLAAGPARLLGADLLQAGLSWLAVVNLALAAFTCTAATPSSTGTSPGWSRSRRSPAYRHGCGPRPASPSWSSRSPGSRSRSGKRRCTTRQRCPPVRRVTVVLDGRRPCGVLTASDLSRALAIAALGETPDRSPSALGDLQPLP